MVPFTRLAALMKRHIYGTANQRETVNICLPVYVGHGIKIVVSNIFVFA